MTVVLLFHPEINYRSSPPVVPVKKCRTIPLPVVISAILFPGLFSYIHHWLKLNDVMQDLGHFHCAS